MLHTARSLRRITERNKTNEGQHSTEHKRRMAREENAHTVPT
jgi:hypothetical protein